MKTPRFFWIATLSIFLPFALHAQTAKPQARVRKTAETVPAFAFEPLDKWKAAVVAGDKSALTNFYSVAPPASAKTPQGDTPDPAEEPAYWAALRSQGLTGLDVKVLEVKTPQPGMMSLVLRIEASVKSSEGEKTGVISAAQIWLQKLGEWKIVRTQRGDIAAKPLRRLPEPAKPNTALYADPAEGPIEIAAALAAATKDHKRVLLVFGGNWCYDCHVLDTTFHSKEFAPLVNANFHVVHVNIGNYDVNLDIAKRYEIPLEKGVPSLAVLAPDGTLLVSMKKGEFESTVRIGPEDVMDFLNKWKPDHNG